MQGSIEEPSFSKIDWERVKTIKIAYWVRGSLFCVALFSLPVLFFAWLTAQCLDLLNLFLGYRYRKLHRFSRVYQRGLRWILVSALAAFLAGPYPKMAIAFLAAYSYLYSYDASQKGWDRLARFFQKK